MENNTKLSPPWETYVKKLRTLFGADPEIRVEWAPDSMLVRLFVESCAKAEALNALLPDFINYGGAELKIEVIPANKQPTKAELFKTAFAGNPLFRTAVQVDVASNPITYVVMMPAIIQFYGDNLHDINGNVTQTVEQTARDVIDEIEGVCFCSDRVQGKE